MKANLAKGTMYLTVSSFIFLISGYLANIWLGRFMGPGLYGVYGIVISLMTVINLTQTSGLPQAVSKFIAENEQHSESILRSGIYVQLISTIIAGLLLFLFAGSLSRLLGDTTLTPYIQASSAILPFYGIFSLYVNYYNGLHKFKTQAVMNTFYFTAKLIAIIALVYFFQIYGAITAFILSPLIALVFWFHFPKKTPHSFPMKRLILFSIPLIGVAIFSNLLQSIDIYFVKAILHSNVFTGIYAANQNISVIPYYATLALSSILYPSISRTISQGLEEETKKLITKSFRVTLLLVSPCVVLISASSEQVLNILYTSSFQQGAQSLSILVLGVGFFTIFTLFSVIISGSGKPYISAMFAGIGVIISSGLCLLLIPRFGMLGASMSTTIATFSIMCLAYFYLYRQFHVILLTKSLVNIIFATVAVFSIAKLLSIPLIFLPIFYISLLIVYIVALILLKEFTQEDLESTHSLLPAKLFHKQH